MPAPSRSAGRTVDFTHPVQAMHAGLATVFQEFNLLPERTVAQNVFLGREPRKGGFVDSRGMVARDAALLDELGIDVHRPDGPRAARSPSPSSRSSRSSRRSRSTPASSDGRADRRARRPRGRAALRDRPPAHRARRRDPLRLAPAQGDLRPLRHHHRAEGRRARLERPGVRARHRRARAADGGPLDLDLLPRAEEGTEIGEPRLELRGVGNDYVDGIDLDLRAGEIVGRRRACRAAVAPNSSRRSSGSRRSPAAS